MPNVFSVSASAVGSVATKYSEPPAVTGAEMVSVYGAPCVTVHQSPLVGHTSSNFSLKIPTLMESPSVPPVSSSIGRPAVSK